jgi:hypothetical protein
VPAEAGARLADSECERVREEATTTRTNIAAILIALIATSLTIGQPALCADLVGRVLNSHGEAVSGVTVTVVKAAADVDAGKGISDANGAYAISNLTPGTYKFNIVPGQWVMSYIPDGGLTVNWGLAPHSPPVAVATLGTAADSSGAAAAPSKISHAESRPDTIGSGRVQGTSN